MCTSIVEIVPAQGAGKGDSGWFELTSAVVSYDHPHHARLEEAILLDFVNPSLGPGARVAVEISLQSAKDLVSALSKVTAAAQEQSGEAGDPYPPPLMVTSTASR